MLYPKEREDGIIGQHYNLTQIPFEIPVNPTTRLALDFHVEIHFEVNIETPILHDIAKAMITQRLKAMDIPLGTDIIDLIVALCFSTKREGQRGVWNGVRYARYKFFCSKVCKSYHSVARNANLSVKIKSDNLLDTTASAVFYDILRNSFLKTHDYEIVDVQSGCLHHGSDS